MINILFCGNYKVFDGALTELISITNKTSEAVNCYIYTMDVSRINPDFISMSDEQIDFLNKVIKSKNSENKVTKIDVTEILYSLYFVKVVCRYCTKHARKAFIFRYRYDGCKRHSRIIQHKY